MLREFFRRQRVNRLLAQGLEDKNEAQIAEALSQGACPDKVKCTFEEPMHHFQTLYEIKGALQIAIHQRLSQEIIAALIHAGASVPLDENHRPNVEKLLYDPDDRRHAEREGLVNFIHTQIQARQLQGQTQAAPSSAPRIRF